MEKKNKKEVEKLPTHVYLGKKFKKRRKFKKLKKKKEKKKRKKERKFKKIQLAGTHLFKVSVQNDDQWAEHLVLVWIHVCVLNLSAFRVFVLFFFFFTRFGKTRLLFMYCSINSNRKCWLFCSKQWSCTVYGPTNFTF